MGRAIKLCLALGSDSKAASKVLALPILKDKALTLHDCVPQFDFFRCTKLVQGHYFSKQGFAISFSRQG
jgi:hypothetical protein